jgi:murein DD-endopeptidase MepM/ murein hydrolase activator NlpD
MKKVRCFALIFAVVCGILYSAGYSSLAYSEAELSQKLREIGKENERLDRLIREANSSLTQNAQLMELYSEKMQAMSLQVDYYNNLLYNSEREIERSEAGIEKIKREISEKESEIEARRNEIHSLDMQNRANLKRFGELVASMYKTGSFTNVFSVTDDFAAFTMKLKMMENISRRNAELMDELLESMQELEVKTEELNAELFALEETKTTLEAEYRELNIKKAGLEKNAAEASALNDEYRQFYHKYAQQAQALELERSKYFNAKRINLAEADEFDRQLKELIIQRQSNSAFIEGDWLYPVDRRFTRITTYFGFDSWRNGQHNGIDIAGSEGNSINWANIYAVKDGVVAWVQTTYISGYSYGKYIVIDHGGGYTSLYGHCNDIYVQNGDKVKAGQKIGAVGSTGWSTGPHLHFEIRINGVPQDPFSFIKK